MPLSEEVLSELRQVVGVGQVIVSDLEGFATDWTGAFVGQPGAVVRPASTDQVQQVVRICGRHKVEMVPQGGNTGLVGGTLAISDQLIINLTRLNWMGDIDRSCQQVDVGAGAILQNIQDHVGVVGLRYAVDFAARGSATIGGTVATNAGGINVLRFGMTRQQVVGIEAVLANGDLISHMDGLLKDNTGYDLQSLLCGSEGTLAIITAVRLKLVAEFAHVSTMLLGCDDVRSALELVSHMCARVQSVEAAEIFFSNGAYLVSQQFDIAVPFESAVYVLLESTADDDQTDLMVKSLSAYGFVGHSAIATDEKSRRALWRLREEHTTAIATQGTPRKFDVTLPADRLASFIDEVEVLIGVIDPSWKVVIFGHAADGNMHVNVLGPQPDDVALDVQVLGLVARLGGSISAEHGIGRAKKTYLNLCRSNTEISLMRSIKRACDPNLLLNPGVIFDQQ